MNYIKKIPQIRLYTCIVQFGSKIYYRQIKYLTCVQIFNALPVPNVFHVAKYLILIANGDICYQGNDDIVMIMTTKSISQCYRDACVLDMVIFPLAAVKFQNDCDLLQLYLTASRSWRHDKGVIAIGSGLGITVSEWVKHNRQHMMTSLCGEFTGH